MRRSFRTKVILIFLAGVLSCMALLSVSCEFLLRPLLLNNTKKKMEEFGQEMETMLSASAEEELSLLLDEINQSYVIRTVILSAQGETLYAYSGEFDQNGQHKSRRALRWATEYQKAAPSEKIFYMERYDENDTLRYLICVRETKSGELIVMDKSIRGIEQDADLITVFISLMGIVVAIFGTALWSFAIRPITGRLAKMSRITQQMAQLNFEEKINYHSQDEIGVLADSIDAMSSTLKSSIESLKEDLEIRKMMVRSLAHEVKTPITTIRGYAETAQLVTEENARVQHYCEIIVEECDSMDHLVNEMLEMSRLEEAGAICEKAAFEAADLIRTVQQRTALELSGTQLLCSAQAQLLTGNQELLARAVFNYVENAAKYGEPGQAILLNGCCQDGGYLFTVENRGTAIPPKEQEAIWDLFYKTDKSRRRNNSYGIGLAIVRQIAHLHGGRVSVSSQDGTTVFCLWIPLPAVQQP